MAQAVPHFFPSRTARRGPAFFPSPHGPALLARRAPRPAPRVHLPETEHPHALPLLSPHARCPLSPMHGPHPSAAPPSLSFLPVAQWCARYHRRVRRDPYPAVPRDPRRSPFNWPQRTPLHPHLHALAASNPSRRLRLAPPRRLLCAAADQPRHSLPAPANHPRSLA